MIASPASVLLPTPSASPSDVIHLARVTARVIAATVLGLLIGLVLADFLATLGGYPPLAAFPTSGGARLLLACPALLLALDAVVLARLDRICGPRRAGARGSAVRYVGSDASELVARGRVALAEDGPSIAGYLFDRAIAADPSCEQAWLLKAACQDSQADRLACLEAGLALNPRSATLKEALSCAGRSERGRGVTSASEPAFLQSKDRISGVYAQIVAPPGTA